MSVDDIIPAVTAVVDAAAAPAEATAEVVVAVAVATTVLMLHSNTIPAIILRQDAISYPSAKNGGGGVVDVGVADDRGAAISLLDWSIVSPSSSSAALSFSDAVISSLTLSLSSSLGVANSANRD